MRGVPLNLGTIDNVEKLAGEAGEFLELEDVALARGFLRVKILIDTRNPMAAGCWLAKGGDKDSWVEFSYEKLQDFCYKCGRIRHAMNECSFKINRSDVAAYEDWTRAKMVRDF
ncbi:uncharacterized protein [Malus domestica]|uniref:uncharacterized protein n=1 Tax=Malus domestica TaxID=3750 RepID=UPI00397622D1